MKRVVLYAVALCLVISVVAGCTGISGLGNETEGVTEAYEDVADTEIVKRFYEAYDFWVSWIYGQDKDYDFMPEYAGFDFGPYLCAIKEDAPIQSVAELEAEMKKYFTKELCERFMAATRPVEIDGRLCMYGGDVGGPYSEAKNIAVEKIDDERYRLKLDIWSCMDEERPDLPDQIVYYVFEDGAWVFENNDEDEFFYCEELPEYLNEEYTPYNEILRTYYAALWQKWDEEKRAKHNLTDVIRYYDDENRMKNVGYCMLDLDADGQKELLIGTMEYEVNDIYDLYTVKDDRVVQVALGWERCRFYIYEEDGKYKIIKHGSGGASLISDDHYVLEKGSLKHEWSVVMDGFADPKNPWFLADDDEFDVTDDTPISQEKYLELTEGYHGKSLKPEYIPFETLG